MSWLSSQNSDLIVNNLTINGKLNLSSTTLTVNELISVDTTNEINMGVENVMGLITQTLNINAGTTNISGLLDVSGEFVCDGNITSQGNISTSKAVVSQYAFVGGETPNFLTESAKQEGAYINWNMTGGVGETDFICNQGDGVGGFNFYIQEMNNTSEIEPVLSINPTTTTINGNLNVIGGITSSQTQTQTWEFLYYNLLGDATFVSIPFNLAQPNGTTNYAVFTSIYYGYSGSGGTYTAGGGSIANITITNQTAGGFNVDLTKTSGQNVNVYLICMVVYNPALNFPVSY